MLKTCKIEDNEQSESRNLRNEQLKGWITRTVETIKETGKSKGKIGKLTAKKETEAYDMLILCRLIRTVYYRLDELVQNFCCKSLTCAELQQLNAENRN